MSSNTIIKVLANESAVIEQLCTLIEELANSAIIREDVFKVGLSG